MKNEDTMSDLFSNIVEATALLDYHLGEKYNGEIYQQYFVRWFDKARKVDPRTTFFWIQKHKNKFDKNMLKYAQSFYKKEF